MWCHTALYFPFSDHQGTKDVEETEDLEIFSSNETLEDLQIFKQFFILWILKKLLGGYAIRIFVYKLHTDY